MLSLDELHAEEKLESIENSLGIERQKSLEAKISPILGIGEVQGEGGGLFEFRVKDSNLDR